MAAVTSTLAPCPVTNFYVLSPVQNMLRTIFIKVKPGKVYHSMPSFNPFVKPAPLTKLILPRVPLECGEQFANLAFQLDVSQLGNQTLQWFGAVLLDADVSSAFVSVGDVRTGAQPGAGWGGGGKEVLVVLCILSLPFVKPINQKKDGLFSERIYIPIKSGIYGCDNSRASGAENKDERICQKCGLEFVYDHLLPSVDYFIRRSSAIYPNCIHDDSSESSSFFSRRVRR